LGGSLGGGVFFVILPVESNLTPVPRRRANEARRQCPAKKYDALGPAQQADRW